MAHLKVFLEAILNFNAGVLARESNSNPDLIGIIDKDTGDYMLSAAEVQKVHKRFK